MAAGDATGRFPWEALDALSGGGLHAAHTSSTVIIEEVARVCAAWSLSPPVNKLGTVPPLLAGPEQLNRRYLSAVAPR